jgi:hypothetical protein
VFRRRIDRHAARPSLRTRPCLNDRPARRTVILFQLSFSPRLDSCAERLVGLTLIVLAIYVLGSLVWGNPKAIPPSRAALIIRGLRKLRRRLTSTPPAAAAASDHDERPNLADGGSPMLDGVSKKSAPKAHHCKRSRE